MHSFSKLIIAAPIGQWHALSKQATVKEEFDAAGYLSSATLGKTKKYIYLPQLTKFEFGAAPLFPPV